MNRMTFIFMSCKYPFGCLIGIEKMHNEVVILRYGYYCQICYKGTMPWYRSRTVIKIFLYLQLIIFESINVSFEKFISMLQSTCTLTFKLRGRWSKKYDGHRKLTSEFPAAKIWHSISHWIFVAYVDTKSMVKIIN